MSSGNRTTKLVGMIITLLLASASSQALEFVAYGDTRTNKDAHQSVVDAFSDKATIFL